MTLNWNAASVASPAIGYMIQEKIGPGKWIPVVTINDKTQDSLFVSEANRSSDMFNEEWRNFDAERRQSAQDDRRFRAVMFDACNNKRFSNNLSIAEAAAQDLNSEAALMEMDAGVLLDSNANSSSVVVQVDPSLEELTAPITIGVPTVTVSETSGVSTSGGNAAAGGIVIGAPVVEARTGGQTINIEGAATGLEVIGGQGMAIGGTVV